MNTEALNLSHGPHVRDRWTTRFIMHIVALSLLPATVAGVVYQNGAFSALQDGQFDQPIAAEAYKAAQDALNGWDPSGGAIYYYNPAKTTNSWIYSRPVITVIGNHVFAR